jgi:hypothetical protein
MTAQRISQDFIDSYYEKFTEEIAMQFRKQHEDNCHHWDYTFLLWHRKFVTQFWQTIDLPRTYAVLTDEHDRALYSSLKKTVLIQGQDFIFTEDSEPDWKLF